MPKPKPRRPSGRAVPTLPCPGLATARRLRGYSSALTAATALDVPGERWRKWETRGRAPRLELERVAAEWGCELEELTTPPDEEAALRADAIALRTAAVALSERVCRFLGQGTGQGTD